MESNRREFLKGMAMAAGAVGATPACASAAGGAGEGGDVPTLQLSDADFTDGVVDILSLLCKAGLVPSKSEARRAVEQGGVTVDGERVTDIKATYPRERFAQGVLLRRGKKSFMKVKA